MSARRSFLPSRSALLAGLLLLVGCPSEGSEVLPSCTAPDDMALNSVVASIEGDAWTGATTGFQTIAGPAIQFSATGADDDGDQVNITLRLRRATLFSVAEDGETLVTEPGDDIERVIADEDPPVDFAIRDANEDGANATVTISPDGSMSTGEGDGGGFLRITSLGVPEGGEQEDPKEVIGCFSLRAESQDGERSVEISDGGFRLTEI